MCGIVGFSAGSRAGIASFRHSMDVAIENLKLRGPNAQATYVHDNIGLGHTRLSVIDTSSASNQPIWDNSGRYCMVFNGEIYNYKSLRRELEQQGIHFETTGDSEVLLYCYIIYGKACLHKLNGFFAFCIYDNQQQTFFIARDRVGIKPLYYSANGKGFCFASELKGLLPFCDERALNKLAVMQYFHLHYIPAPQTIYDHVLKLPPGHFVELTVQDGEHLPIVPQCYYTREELDETVSMLSYSDKKAYLLELLTTAVAERMVADVPIGAFLSGGIDSSLIVALAAKQKPDLKTYSIGFKDAAHFDETYYAQLVADQCKTDHTVLKLSEEDILQDGLKAIDYFDEPFADSSALLVNILCSKVSEGLTVALSGDGADELFAGYHKYMGEWQMQQSSWKSTLVGRLGPIWNQLPQSRSSKFGNTIRQLDKFAKGYNMSSLERYWNWCGVGDAYVTNSLFSKGWISESLLTLYYNQSKNYQPKASREPINAWCNADIKLTLPDDMLTKVDRMSMKNGLEVRVPFLDHRIVEFANGLDEGSKIRPGQKKRILNDLAKAMLPAELYNRPKQGFEMPVKKWLLTAEVQRLLKQYADEDFLREQQIFNTEHIKSLMKTLVSTKEGDSASKLFAYFVFQQWFSKLRTV